MEILWTCKGSNRVYLNCNTFEKMSSNWRPVLNNYLADFEARTTTALEDINRLLRQSGQNIDDRIKDYFMKSVKNR